MRVEQENEGLDGMVSRASKQHTWGDAAKNSLYVATAIVVGAGAANLAENYHIIPYLLNIGAMGLLGVATLNVAGVNVGDKLGALFYQTTQTTRK